MEDEQRETKRTPTPWRFSHAYVSGAERSIEIGSGDCDYKVGSLACVLPNSPVYDGEREARLMADAAFIVRAANSHENLIEACKLALGEFEKVIPPDTPIDPNNGALMHLFRVKAVIAAAVMVAEGK